MTKAAKAAKPAKTAQATEAARSDAAAESAADASVTDAGTSGGAKDARPRRHRGRRLLLVILGAVAAVALSVYFIHLNADDIGGDGYVSPYNWANLSMDEKGRLHYVDAEGQPASLVGIDTSEWDTDTDWAAVAADGVQFAMIRIGYRGSTLGGLYVDDRFEENYQGAKDNGILVGLYFFSQATTAAEGREEAEFILDVLAGRPVDLPIAFDHEGYSDTEGRAFGLSDDVYTAAARAFCSRIEHGGYMAAIYGNRYAISKLDEDVREDYTIWLAEWETDLPHAKFDFSIWQFTNAGHVDGMWRRVDTSIWFTNEVPFKTPETRAAAAAEADEANGDATDDTGKLTPAEAETG